MRAADRKFPIAAALIALASFAAPVAAATKADDKACLDALPHPDAEHAVIVIYRVPSLKGMAWTHHYAIDGVHRLELRSKQYSAIAVARGQHIVGVGPASHQDYQTVPIEAKAGEAYFIEDHPGYDLYTPDRFFSVDRDAADKALGSHYHCRASAAG